MKTKLTIMIGIFFYAIIFSQKKEDSIFQAKLKEKATKEFSILSKKFAEDKKSYESNMTKLKDPDNLLNPQFKHDSIKTATLKLYNSLVDQCKDQTTKKSHYQALLDNPSVLKDYFPTSDCSSFQEKTLVLKKPSLTAENFLVVGNSIPKKASEIFTSETAKASFLNALSEQDEAHLGDFQIPQDGKPVSIVFHSYPRDSIKKKDSLAITNLLPHLLFKKVNFSINDGVINDIRVTLTDPQGKTEFYFENLFPISMLRFTRISGQTLLSYSKHSSIEGLDPYAGISEEILREYLKIKLSEVFSYEPFAGNNYVPDNAEFQFPTVDNNENIQGKPRRYSVMNKTHLQNMLDIRAYTDFLGLFSDAPNGVFQAEGKADFYAYPFVFKYSPIKIFSKFTPLVKYARLNNNDSMYVHYVNNPDGTISIKDRLSRLQKEYLNIGLTVDVFSGQIFKETAVWYTLYVPTRYGISSLSYEGVPDKKNIISLKTISIGSGLRIDFKRITNFGGTLYFEVTSNSLLGNYDDIKLQKPSPFNTLGIGGELFYYPNNDRKQAIFLRLKSTKDITGGEGSGGNFFQFQFGYSFSLGIGARNAKL